ncbi:HIT family protein [Candidatus Woesearchaeota archaeon]|nr:HIT family protein [Candidatus Woesearchaeota archaeon]
MGDCIFCNTVEGKTKLEKVYEDAEVVAVVHPRGAVPGHILVFPKKHYQVFEIMPDYEIGHLFDVVNKISIAVFEAIQAQGTNIIMQNGVSAGQELPHVVVHIIPRKEGDGLDFQWTPKQMTQEEVSSIELKLKEAASEIGEFEKEKKKEAVKVEGKEEKKKPADEEEKDEDMAKQLERIP